jgi:hypothetical protein
MGEERGAAYGRGDCFLMTYRSRLSICSVLLPLALVAPPEVGGRHSSVLLRQLPFSVL